MRRHIHILLSIVRMWFKRINQLSNSQRLRFVSLFTPAVEIVWFLFIFSLCKDFLSFSLRVISINDDNNLSVQIILAWPLRIRSIHLLKVGCILQSPNMALDMLQNLSLQPLMLHLQFTKCYFGNTWYFICRLINLPGNISMRNHLHHKVLVYWLVLMWILHTYCYSL